MNKTILDLCGGTGAWSQPYRAAGYNVIVIDPASACEGAIRMSVQDFHYANPVHGILAAPPCTEFAASGARWWRGKSANLLDEAISIVRACLRIIKETKPTFWALENPVGRIAKCVPELGKAKLYFDPCEYGDPWLKYTGLWGNFTVPKKCPVKATDKSKMHLMPPSKDRKRLRSITPPNFAKAFFEANP